MDNKNDILDDEIEIIDEIDAEPKMNGENNPNQTVQPTEKSGQEEPEVINTFEVPTVPTPEENKSQDNPTETAMETLQTAEVNDAKAAVPQSENKKEEKIDIANTNKISEDDKRGLTFIIIIFSILIVFIIALPYITDLVEKYTG